MTHNVQGSAVDESSASARFAETLKKFKYSTSNDLDLPAVDDKAAPMAPDPALRQTRLKRGSTINFEEDVDATTTPSSAKRQRQSSKYAPPAKYAHLSPLQDIMEPNLIAIFVGFNPGVRTAQTGYPYAHPSNWFWRLVHSSGLTDRLWRPDEAPNLPKVLLGNTNLVDRPTKDAAELSKEERAAGTPVLEAKVREFKPEAVCIVGKSIWEDIWRYRYGRNQKKTEFKYGWQDEKENMGKIKANSSSGEGPWGGARVFVATSTSGLSASLTPAQKQEIWKPFGDWVQAQRKDRLSKDEPQANDSEEASHATPDVGSEPTSA